VDMVVRQTAFTYNVRHGVPSAGRSRPSPLPEYGQAPHVAYKTCYAMVV
jgi:hypothetical protein